MCTRSEEILACKRIPTYLVYVLSPTDNPSEFEVGGGGGGRDGGGGWGEWDGLWADCTRYPCLRAYIVSLRLFAVV